MSEYYWSAENVEGLRLSPSGQALLVDVDGDCVWIPCSQISDDSEVYKPGDVGELIIPQWLAEEKGLC